MVSSGEFLEREVFPLQPGNLVVLYCLVFLSHAPRHLDLLYLVDRSQHMHMNSRRAKGFEGRIPISTALTPETPERSWRLVFRPREG